MPKITITTKSGPHDLKIGVPKKIKELKHSVTNVFKKAKGVKKPKVEDVIVSSLQIISGKLDRLAEKIENK